MSSLDLLTEKQLSQGTGIPCNTLRYWRANGEGPPYHRLGRSIRYRLSDVEAWLEENKVEPEGGEPRGA